MTTSTSTPDLVLTRVKARDVEEGERVAVFDGDRTILSKVRGANRQIYIVTKSDAGAPVVSEHDPTEIIDVWRPARTLRRPVDVTEHLAGADA